MKRALAVLAIMLAGIGSVGHVRRPALAQPVATPNETRSVPFGDTEIVLYARPQHCLLDISRAADEQLAAFWFRPRAGKKNTYLGAFIRCDELTELRSKRERAQLQLLSYGYYLDPTKGAGERILKPRDQFLQVACDTERARWGSLDLAAETAIREIEAKMEALPVGNNWFGPIIAQDENGCYGIVLSKYPNLHGGSGEYRKMLLTVITEVKRRAVTYTTATPYSKGQLPTFVKLVQSDVAALVKLNP